MDDRRRQIDRYIDGTLDEREAAELLIWVGSDPAHADLFAQLCLLDEHARELLADNLVESPRKSGDRVKKRSLAWSFSAAAAVALLTGGWFAFQASFERNAGQVAVIGQAVGAYQSDDEPWRPGKALPPGGFDLKRGVVRLDFASGARMAVEGPASLEIVDEMHVVLNRGIVTAVIPPSAVGFVVDTSTARIVDLGTAFGVSVEEDGQTDVCVFDGQVTVNRQEALASDGVPQRVREGEAVRTARESATIDTIDFETSRFERAWPVNTGVLQATGAMKFVAPGPYFDPGKYRDSEHIFVFPERKNVELKEPIRVDWTDPGEFQVLPFAETRPLSAGQRVTSYLLQLHAVSKEPHLFRKRRVVGQITFAEPIVGLITRNQLMQETDSLFGHPDVEYESPSRSIEPRPEGDRREGFDTVILAADRRTLILDLRVSPRRIDQFRVLVEAP